MNVGVLCFASAGGSGTVATGLARELAGGGHAMHVIASARPFRLHAAQHGVRFHGADTSDEDGLANRARRVAEVVLAERLDVLHAHYAAPHAVVACRARDLLAGRHHVAVVTTLHGTDVIGAAGAGSADVRAAIASSDGVTAVSRALADAAVASFGIARPRVIPNFVDVGEFRPRATLPAAEGQEPTVVHVSTFRPVKRTTDCIEVFARIARRVSCRLMMVGDGPDAAGARRLAERLGLGERVAFAGEQARVADFLARADLLLMPSAFESFGVAALEAMSCGVPVVASRVGGLPEVVEDGVCGRLLAVGDVDGMASAALAILADPRRARAMGEAGRRIAVERFDARRVAPCYASFYREAMDGGTRGVAGGSER